MDFEELGFDSVPVAGVDLELGYRPAVAGWAAAGCRMVHSSGKVVDAAVAVGFELKVRRRSSRGESSCRFAAVAGGEGRVEGGW